MHFQNVQYLNKESSIYYPGVFDGCSIIADVYYHITSPVCPC